jgi:TolA-binding protein
LTPKGKNPKSEKDSAKPAPVSEKATPPAEEPEVIPPKESLPPTLTPPHKPKKEKKSSGLWGILFFFFLIIAGSIGAGGYYLYQEQMKFQNETLAKLSQLEGQLSALDTEADQTRQNQQSIDTLNQELQQFKTKMDTTLKSHQSSLSTLDEDVMRLKEKLESPAGAPPTQPSIIDETGTEAGPVPGELLPEIIDKGTSEDIEAEEDPDQESQKFVEWMENFFAAIWNWFAGLFS